MKKHKRSARRKFAQSVKRHLGDTYHFVTVPTITKLIDGLDFYNWKKRLTAFQFADQLRRILDIHPFTKRDIEQHIRDSTKLHRIEKIRTPWQGLSPGAIRREDNKLWDAIIRKNDSITDLSLYAQLPTIGGCWVDVLIPKKR